MRYHGTASGPADPFTHQALIYGSDQEFMDVALPFVEEAAAADEPALVAAQERHVRNLRAALGHGAPGITLFSVEQWYETSARTRDKFARWVAEHADSSERVRLIGEPPWAIGHEAQVRDWARHESVLNVAFAGYPVSFICPYEATVLPPEIIEHAHSTHPEILAGGQGSPSETYEDPVEFCTRLDSSVTRPTGNPDQTLSFGLTDLPALRRIIGDLALVAGLERSRADELVLAVHEVATNAVVHGRSPATLRMWHQEGELVFEVSDAGEGIADALAGQLAPPSTSLGGRGLWLTRLVCDAVEIRQGSGCTVAIRATTPSFSPTA
jgi:anti-sigma regulatory factor (Ser/Thr protein kinase)